MDPTDLGPGTATWLGGTGTILLGGFLWLRKFLSRDATDRAMDNADIGTVRRLNELLDSERQADGKFVPHFKPGKELRDRVNEDEEEGF